MSDRIEARQEVIEKMKKIAERQDETGIAAIQMILKERSSDQDTEWCKERLKVIAKNHDLLAIEAIDILLKFDKEWCNPRLKTKIDSPSSPREVKLKAAERWFKLNPRPIYSA